MCGEANWERVGRDTEGQVGEGLQGRGGGRGSSGWGRGWRGRWRDGFAET